jgi:hypothetical protein
MHPHGVHPQIVHPHACDARPSWAPRGTASFPTLCHVCGRPRYRVRLLSSSSDTFERKLSFSCGGRTRRLASFRGESGAARTGPGGPAAARPLVSPGLLRSSSEPSSTSAAPSLHAADFASDSQTTVRTVLRSCVEPSPCEAPAAVAGSLTAPWLHHSLQRHDMRACQVRGWCGDGRRRGWRLRRARLRSLGRDSYHFVSDALQSRAHAAARMLRISLAVSEEW